MFRVTVLDHGVVTDDVEEFATEAEVLTEMWLAAPLEYVQDLKAWLSGDKSEPLVIKESSRHSDLWEYIP